MISCCSSCQKDKKVTLAYSLTASDSYQAPEALQRVQTADKIEDIEVEAGSFFFGMLARQQDILYINKSCIIVSCLYEVIWSNVQTGYARVL